MRYLLFLLTVISVSSCKKYPCEKQGPIGGVTIETTKRGLYQTATVVKCQRGTGLATIIDSTTDITVDTGGNYYGFNYDFSDKYDWFINFYPGDDVITLTDIYFGPQKYQHDGLPGSGELKQCYNDFSCKVNGNTYENSEFFVYRE